MKKKIAFTLAETLIVLVILGVVASITIPALVNRHRENANRTKIKKAMTSYEAALSKMVIENNLKSDTDIDNWASADCSNTRAYFKPTRNGNDNCTFMTADGVWWNISDIKNPVISIDTKTGIDPTKLADLKNTAKDTSDNKIYAMKGWFDENGSLRANDLGKVNDNDKDYLTKLYNFANISFNKMQEKCTTKDNENYTCNGSNLNFKKIHLDDEDALTLEKDYYGKKFCSYEYDSVQDKYVENCTKIISNVTGGDLYISEELLLTSDNAKDENNCKYSRRKSLCLQNGDYWILAKRQCELQGAKLASSAELKKLYEKGQLDGTSTYWAAESYPNDTADAYKLYSSNGRIYGGSYDNENFMYNNIKAICVSK